jgi:hypothetical protein
MPKKSQQPPEQIKNTRTSAYKSDDDLEAIATRWVSAHRQAQLALKTGNKQRYAVMQGQVEKIESSIPDKDWEEFQVLINLPGEFFPYVAS